MKKIIFAIFGVFLIGNIFAEQCNQDKPYYSVGTPKVRAGCYNASELCASSANNNDWFYYWYPSIPKDMDYADTTKSTQRGKSSAQVAAIITKTFGGAGGATRVTDTICQVGQNGVRIANPSLPYGRVPPAVQTYTITYNPNGGTGTTSPTVCRGTTSQCVAASNGYNRPGYTFSEWNDKVDGTGTSYNPGDTLPRVNGLVLYAKWRSSSAAEKVITVTHDLDYEGKTFTANCIENGQLVLPLEARGGYKFLGWKLPNRVTVPVAVGGTTSIACTEANLKFGSGTTATVTAVWESLSPPANPITVTLNKNGGTGSIPNSVQCPKDSVCNLPNASVLSLNGYTFSGKWALESGDNKPPLQGVFSVNSTVYAVRTPTARGDVCVKCGVKNRAGGDLVTCTDSNSVARGNERYRRLSDDATWARGIDGEYHIIVDMSYCDAPSGQRQYTVKYDCGTGGSGTPPYQSPPTNINSPTVLAGQGGCVNGNNIFDGWLSGGIKYSAGNSFTGTEAIAYTMTAQWKQQQSTGLSGVVKIMNSNGQMVNTAQVGEELHINIGEVVGGVGNPTYKWRKTISGRDDDIGNGRIYTIKLDDVGSNIKVTVYYGNGSLTSEPVGAQARSAMEFTVTINGVSQVGETLTAIIHNPPSSGSLTYEWELEKNGATTSRSGGNTYQIRPDDVDSRIRVKVTHSQGSFGQTRYSSYIGPITAAGLPPVEVSIVGGDVPKVGRTLTVNTNNIPASAIGGLTFSWHHVGPDGITLEKIDGAYANTYTPKEEDIGYRLRVFVNHESYAGPLTAVTNAAVQPAGEDVPPVVPSKADALLNEIQAMEKDDKYFNLSGWTSKDGSGFNWMRLGIDAAGAAVVGTTAGVLTNSLMKKSQLESGRKSIQCTYGQSGTASYSEPFVVR